LPAGASVQITPIESWLTTRATINSPNWTNLYIPTTATTDSHVFISIDNRPYGGHAPRPGTTVTVKWDNIRWVTGKAVTQLNGQCGKITIDSGPGQAMYAEIGTGVNVKANGVATPSAKFAAYILDQTNLDLYLDYGRFSLDGTNGVVCQNDTVCKVANNGTWFFVLGCDGSGSVKYNYVFGASIGAPCATTTTTIATTIGPTNTTNISATTLVSTSSNGNGTTVTVTTSGGDGNATSTTIVNSNTTTSSLATSATGGDSAPMPSRGGKDTDTGSASMLLLNAVLLLLAASFLISLL
jgi:hypothetical protein